MLYAPLSAFARRMSKLVRPETRSIRRRYESAARFATMETLESRTMLSATITVLGNSVNIAAGDTTPAREDFTDFGPIGVKTGAVTRTYTITNAGDAQLTVSSLNITGLTPRDFTITANPSGTVAAGASTTFTISFDPRAAGNRKARVTVKTNDPAHATFTFDIKGTGLSTHIRSDGLQIATTQAGTGTDLVRNGQFLKMNYTGYLLNGTKFDSSLNPGRDPFEFTIGAGSVIQGWERGILGMKVGEHRVLIVPPDLAYGSQGQGSIPPNATLIFEVELLAIQGPTLVVNGNGVSIADGDTTPSVADDTDFGDLGTSGTVVHTFEMTESGQGFLTSRGSAQVISISGTGASQFDITQPYVVNNQTFFSVRFRPTVLGTSTATITVRTNDPAHPDFSFTIQGTASAAPPVDLAGVFGAATSVPPQVGDGDTFSVPIDITNWGFLQANGQIRITVKASSDGTWHDADPTIGTATPTIHLGKHATGTFSVPLTIPPTATLATGTYKLVAKVETIDNMGEVNTADNIVTRLGTDFNSSVSMKVVEALSDLKVTLGNRAPNWAVFNPGETFMIPVKITNIGIRDAAASEATPIKIDVRKSADATYDGTDDLIQTINLTVPIGVGKSTTVRVPVTIPAGSIPEDFFVVAKVDPDETLAEIDDANNTGASTKTTAGLYFGNLGRGGPSTLNFFDTDGTKVTVSLTGGGFGQITKDADGFQVTVNGSLFRTRLNVNATRTATPGDDGRFTADNVTINGAIRAVQALEMDVAGDFKVTGSADTVNLGNFVGSGVLQIGSFGARRPVYLDLTAGDIKDVVMTSGIGIKTLKVVRWRNTDATTDKVTAPWIASLRVTGSDTVDGDFQAGLSLTSSRGLGRATPTLVNAAIANDLSNATWDVSGKIGVLNIAGDVLSSTLNAVAMGTVHVAGNVTGSHIKLTKAVGGSQALGSLTVDGTVTGSDLRSTGNVGSLRLGTVVDSLFFAGVQAAVTAKPTATANFINADPRKLPRIGSITLTGLASAPAAAVLVNSSFAAGRIGFVSFPKRDTAVVDAGSAAVPFGFATRLGNVGSYVNGPASAGLYVAGPNALIS